MSVATPTNLINAVTETDEASHAHSFTGVSGRLYLASVFGAKSPATVLTPTASSDHWGSWTQVSNGTVASANGIQRETMFAMIAPSSQTEVLTFTFGETWLRNGAIIDEIASGFDPSGTIVQGVSAITSSSTLGAVTLAAFASALNATYGVFHQSTFSTALTAGSGFGLVVQNNSIANIVFGSEFRADNDTSVDMNGASDNWRGIAVEIKALAATGTPDDVAQTRGLKRGLRRGLANAMAMTLKNGLYRPRESLLIVPVGLALEGV